MTVGANKTARFRTPTLTLKQQKAEPKSETDFSAKYKFLNATMNPGLCSLPPFRRLTKGIFFCTTCNIFLIFIPEYLVKLLSFYITEKNLLNK